MNLTQRKYKVVLLVLVVFLMVFEFKASAQSAATTVQNDPGLKLPQINTSPLPVYDYERLDYGMTIGIERTPKGRIWACWVGGGDNEDAFFVLNTSDDNGKTWSKPRVVIDPHDPALGEKRRTIVGNLWTDPLGRLWLFFDQSLTHFDGRNGNWYTICENPDADTPVWSEPVRIWDGCSLNKPMILSDGTWLLNISLWDKGKINPKFKDKYPELDPFRMANVFASTDQGKTWTRRGGIVFPKPQFDEHHIIERRDGTLWMTARTGDGIWESVSHDKGFTWSEPQKYLEHIASRHHMRRLQSGRILFVRHGALNEKTRFRSKLTAYLSEDDGKTWIGGLMLDERRGISYPDGFQAPDGTIYISYDRNRDWDGEILMARFTEEDILKGQFKSKRSKPKILISRPLGLDKLPAPSEVTYNEKRN